MSGRREVLVEGTAYAKVLGQSHAWVVTGTVRRPVCLEQSEQGGGQRGQSGEGQVVPGIVGYGKDLNAYPTQGCPGGCE